ncbi:MAG: hypothetical protein SGI77_10715 [Pirellulaceae bacterium]|nr:hypothetical protein [Pirellulaceae bacterium]
MIKSLIVLFLSLLLGNSLLAQSEVDPPVRWWKGNLHTHSLWSDGDDFPEMIAEWYESRGYNFLALSDHNVLSQGMRWMDYDKIVARGDAQIVEKYFNRFGNSWVETKGKKGTSKYQIRLKPLDEFRYLVEQRGKFILIPGEEITDKFDGHPVHRNATNLAEQIAPLGGASIREVMQNNLRSVLEQEKRLGREILPHLNHPNFGYAINYEDLASVVAEQFFEVFNGHPGVNQLGDHDHPNVESMWDLANAIRLTVLGAPPLLGLGTDDSHEYHGEPGSHPGRGWVMVRARYLTPEHLIRAMKAGDFYASSGVTLDEVAFDKKTRKLRVSVKQTGDEKYRIDFVATLKKVAPESSAERTKEVVGDEGLRGLPTPENTGRIVATFEGTEAEYPMNGTELYVRAVVTSNLPPVDPSWKEQKQQAWTQPVGY